MQVIPVPTNRPFNWWLYLIVWALAVVGAIAVVPFSLTTVSASLEAADVSLPLPLIIAIGIAQNAVLQAAAAGVGLLAAGRIGLGLPFLRGQLEGQPIWDRFGRVALLAAVVGVVAGLVIVGLEQGIFAPAMAAAGTSFPPESQPPAWQGLLAALYGGFGEEVLLRLFVLSVLAWSGSRFSHTGEGRPTLAVLWIANLLAAVLFGLGHLPATVQAGVPLTGLVVVRAIVLNGLAGLAFGWLYWTRGLESAMVSHLCAGLVLHVLFPI